MAAGNASGFFFLSCFTAAGFLRLAQSNRLGSGSSFRSVTWLTEGRTRLAGPEREECCSIFSQKIENVCMSEDVGFCLY